MKHDQANILMVDDQPAKLLSYEVILSELGENLIPARSAREALEQLLRHDIAVVLMDVSMPEIDGFELADMMHQHPRFNKTAIIFISAVHLTDMDRIKGYESGAVDYISVPVVPELLRAKVGVFAELHRKTRQLERLNAELERRVEERTEQLRESEQQLHERLAELEAIMQVLPVGVAVAQDVQGSSIKANSAFSAMLGASLDQNIAELVSDSSGSVLKVYENGALLSVAEHPLQRSARTGESLGTVELEVRHRERHPIHILASASPLFDRDGKVRGAVGAFFDVTGRKHLEDLLRERADLLELATEAIMVRDKNGVVRFWNSGAETLYGWTSEEVVGKISHDILRTEFPAGLTEVEAALDGDGTWDGRLTHVTRDGRQVIVASRQALKPGSNVILEINRDITAELRAEDALRKTERLAAMGRMAGIIAHEINNPLEAITNAFYLLRDHPSLDEEARYYAKLGEEELRRVAHITRQTLGFYRESRDPVEVSLPALLDDILELQARVLELSKVTVEKRYRTSRSIYGFPVELKQVFLNLIGNAAQAMPKGGTLRLHVFEPAVRAGQSNEICISISDTGTGIDSESAKHLFEPFFTTKSTKGTGLGLWISKGIIQKYGGSIRFRSVALSECKITCFQVVLPASESHSSTSVSVVSLPQPAEQTAGALE